MEQITNEERIVDSVSLKEELSKLPKQQFFASGNKYLDELIGGFAEGDLILLGGSAKSGKSTLLQTWTRQFAMNGIGCLWFSVEMSNREFLGRFGDKLPIFYLPRVMPTQTTHLWIEKKIQEAKKAHDIKIVFVDHIGMVADESMYRERNHVEVMDSRLFRLKRFALKERICLIAVAPFQLQALRKKKTEPSSGDFRGSAMSSYTADTLLALDRNMGTTKIRTMNEGEKDWEELAGEVLMPTDSYLYVMDSRRKGTRKARILMKLTEEGDLIEV